MKINTYSSLIIFLIFSCSTIQGCLSPEKGKQVTERYNPDFFVKNPQIMNGTLSALFSFSTLYLLAHIQNQSLHELSWSSLLTALCVFCGSYVYQKYHKNTDPLDLLLYNPLSIVQKFNGIRMVFLVNLNKTLFTSKNLQSLPIQIDKIRSKCDQYEKIHPLFFIGECYSKNNWVSRALSLPYARCPFQRNINPHFRSTFENQAVTLLLKHIQNNKKEGIHSAHFGCGGALSDLIIMAKTLSQLPDANITIHMIDKQHGNYVAVQEHNKDLSHEIFPQTRSIDNSAIAYLESKKATEKSESEQRKIVQSIYLDTVHMCNQFLNYLHNTFPSATVSLFVHSSTENYLGYIKRKKIPHPDIVLAADIQATIDIQDNSLEDYRSLCTEVLWKKKTSSNLLLGQNDRKENGLLSYSLDKINPNEWKLVSSFQGL